MVRVQLPDQVQKSRRASRVEPGGRLVEEQQPGPADDADATSMRRRWPPDSLRTRVWRRSARPTVRDQLVGVPGVGGSSGRSAARSRRPSARRRRRRPAARSRFAAPLDARGAGVGAEHADLAAASRGRWPSRISTVVVLPAPFGPSRANTSPWSMSRSMPSTAATAPYRLVSARTRTAVDAVMHRSSAPLAGPGRPPDGHPCPPAGGHWGGGRADRDRVRGPYAGAVRR